MRQSNIHPKEQEYLKRHGRYRMVGLSDQMIEVYNLIHAFGPTNMNVLITGENGTGKEMVARALHALYKEGNTSFVAVNGGAHPDTLIESLFFGHRKGAFTGADQDQGGYFVQANYGTLFLDEITQMPPIIQSKMLRVLEEKKVRMLGAQEETPLELRVVSATNAYVGQAVNDGKLRQDLYFRISQVQISLPPLRERGEDDIRFLAEYYAMKFDRIYGKEPLITESGYRYLQDKTWPGNIRELRDFIQKAVVINSSTPMDRSFFETVPIGDYERMRQLNTQSSTRFGIKVLPLIEMERQNILAALQLCDNHKIKAAEMLCISTKTLHNKLNRYNLRDKVIALDSSLVSGAPEQKEGSQNLPIRTIDDVMSRLPPELDMQQPRRPSQYAGPYAPPIDNASPMMKLSLEDIRIIIAHARIEKYERDINKAARSLGISPSKLTQLRMITPKANVPLYPDSFYSTVELRHIENHVIREVYTSTGNNLVLTAQRLSINQNSILIRIHYAPPREKFETV